MSSVSNFVKFYRKCYRADNRGFSIWNAFKIKDSYWSNAKEEELATGRMPRVPIPNNVGEDLLKKIKIHVREKNLVYGILFVSGKLSGLNGLVTERNICSPLIYFDAEIELDNDNYYYRIDINNPHINSPLLSEITCSEDDGEPMKGFPEIIGVIDNLKLGSLISWLNKNSIVEETLNLVRFPKLINKADFKILTDERDILSVLPAAVLMLVDHPKSSRGILHELKTLESGEDYSPPLKALFSSVNEELTGKKTDVDNIPGLLSRSQVKALDIASNHVLGLVSGPPGTGKSYTIAAIALDRLLQGESVLIVSETDQSIDVINDKLIKDFNTRNVVLRAGTKSFLRTLKKRLDSWLKFGVESVDNAHVRDLHKTLKVSKKLIEKQEKKFIKRASESIRWGSFLAERKNKLKPSLIDKLILSYISWRIGHGELHWKQLAKLQLLLKNRDKNAAKYLNLHTVKRVADLLNKHRSELSKFNMAIRARTSQKQLSLHSEIDYKVIFKAFPVWLASLDIIHHVLPLKKQLFDLVIIDEATQCNIASVLPVLQRAKRALIVGDSKQLRHVSFLPYEKERELFLSSGFDGKQYESYSYRRNSILDLASNAIKTQNAVVMLDEHYRSKPDLIAFSNQRFYDNRLKIMQHRPEELMVSNIIVKKVEGERDKKGVNKVEAQAVIDQVRKTIAQYNNKILKPSIGVLSPFREQVNYLEKQLLKQVSINDIENHAIRIATPYGFQGDEKDYMFLSITIDKASMRAAAYLNREDMFNVAITRARQRKYIYISSDYRLFSSNNLFRKYMESLERFDEMHLPVNNVFDKFQIEVCESLSKSGIVNWKAYPVAGKNIDILCSINGKNIAIDLIGFPGEYAEFFELDTYYLFSRAGLEVFPLPYGLWETNKDLCIRTIKALN